MTTPALTPDQRDFAATIGAIGGAALATDADPNVTPPDPTRVFLTPRPQFNSQQILELVASGGTCTVTIYVFSVIAQRWFVLAVQALNNPDQFVALGNGISSIGIPDDVPMFLRVTTAGGARFVGALFH